MNNTKNILTELTNKNNIIEKEARDSFNNRAGALMDARGAISNFENELSSITNTLPPFYVQEFQALNRASNERNEQAQRIIDSLDTNIAKDELERVAIESDELHKKFEQVKYVSEMFSQARPAIPEETRRSIKEAGDMANNFLKIEEQLSKIHEGDLNRKKDLQEEFAKEVNTILQNEKSTKHAEQWLQDNENKELQKMPWLLTITAHGHQHTGGQHLHAQEEIQSENLAESQNQTQSEDFSQTVSQENTQEQPQAQSETSTQTQSQDSLINDYADVSTDMPSYTDPED